MLTKKTTTNRVTTQDSSAGGYRVGRLGKDGALSSATADTFTLDQAEAITKRTDWCILPPNQNIKHLPEMQLTKGAELRLRHLLRDQADEERARRWPLANRRLHLAPVNGCLDIWVVTLKGGVILTTENEQDAGNTSELYA